MGRRGVVWLLLAALAAAATPPVREAVATGVDGPQDQAAELKARLEREGDPIKKARLELRLAELALNEATRLYEKGDTEKGLARLEEMLSLVVAAYDRLQGTGCDPRKRPSGFKETEIKMREFSRRVEDLRVSLTIEEREGIEKIEARLVELRDNLLNRLMRVKEPKK